MNIIEAAKSGKKIRREGWRSSGVLLNLKDPHYTLELRDILADDWEVEPVILTREKLIGAWDVATYREHDLTKIRDQLILELGL